MVYKISISYGKTQPTEGWCHPSSVSPQLRDHHGHGQGNRANELTVDVSRACLAGQVDTTRDLSTPDWW